MELKDTIEMMQSPDYKERFIAEYNQLVIRVDKLYTFLQNYINDKLDFKPYCSKELLTAQYSAMNTYRGILKERARIEGINLEIDNN